MLLLAHVVCVERLVLLLEHLQVGLVVSFEFISVSVLYLLLVAKVLFFLLHALVDFFVFVSMCRCCFSFNFKLY